MKITRTGHLFLCAVTLSVLGATAWFPSLAGVVLSVLLALLACGIATVRRPAFAHLPPRTCFAGVPARGIVEVTNPSRRLPLIVRAVSVLYREERPERPLRVRVRGPWSVLPGETRRIAYPLKGRRRGRLAFEEVSIEVSGLPPILSRRFAAPLTDDLLVFPRPARVMRPLPALSRGLARFLETAATVRRGIEDEFYGLREYRPGEDVRRVHWRTSFKWPGRLRVMEFAGAETGPVKIFLDATRGPDPRPRFGARFERAVSAAGALWDHLDREGVPVTLCLKDREFSDRRHFRGLLEELALLQPAAEPPSPPRPDPRCAVVFITANPGAPGRPARDPAGPDEDIFVLGPRRLRDHFQIL